MDETDRPDDRRAAGYHEAAKSGILKRKKTKTCPRLSCKIEYLLTSNHSDGSIASEFFTGDYLARHYFRGCPIGDVLWGLPPATLRAVEKDRQPPLIAVDGAVALRVVRGL